MTWWGYRWATSTAAPPAWDDGVRHFKQRSVLPTELPVSLAFVRDKVLRVANGTVDDEFITMAIWAAYADAEDQTQRAIKPETWVLRLDGFPSGGVIELPMTPPLISVTSVEYADADGDTQTLTASPEEYRVVSAGEWHPARVTPPVGESWPSTRAQEDAVTITYRAGYENPDDPRCQQIVMGICTMVGELYKHRTLSVQEIQNLPTILQVRSFWKRVWY